MNIMFISNHGGGFADNVTVKSGTSIVDFLEARDIYNPGEYIIRVNREVVTRDYVLNEGDRVTVTPTNIDGSW